MNVRLRLSAVLLVLLVLAAAAVAVAEAGPVSVSVKAPALKASGCKSKSEKSGCVLPKTAKYTGKLADGGTVSLARDPQDHDRFAFALIPTGGCAPARGSIGRFVVGKQVKVGKSYKIDESTLTISAINDLAGTLKVTAKKATFTGTWTSYKLGPGRRKAMPLEILCERTVTASARRTT